MLIIMYEIFTTELRVVYLAYEQKINEKLNIFFTARIWVSAYKVFLCCVVHIAFEVCHELKEIPNIIGKYELRDI